MKGKPSSALDNKKLLVFIFINLSLISNLHFIFNKIKNNIVFQFSMFNCKVNLSNLIKTHNYLNYVNMIQTHKTPTSKATSKTNKISHCKSPNMLFSKP